MSKNKHTIERYILFKDKNEVDIFIKKYFAMNKLAKISELTIIQTPFTNVKSVLKKLKNNFKKCGLVYLSGKDERFAFEKIVK